MTTEERESADVWAAFVRQYRLRGIAVDRIGASILRGEDMPATEWIDGANESAMLSRGDCESWPIILIARHEREHRHDDRRNGCCDELDALLGENCGADYCVDPGNCRQHDGPRKAAHV